MDIKITQVTPELGLMYVNNEIVAINNIFDVEAKISNLLCIRHTTESDDINIIKKEIKDKFKEFLKEVLKEGLDE